MRDVERRVPKAPGTRRVLVLGDSYVEGQQVPADSNLTRCLERDLDSPGGRRVEVWNCGVSGYTTSQELLYLSHIAAGWHPDLVVLCFLSGNDLADAVPENATSLRNRPFYRLSGDRVVLDRSQFRNDPPGVGWLRTHSRAFTWASTMRQAMAIQKQQRAAASHHDGRVPADLQIYAVRPDSSWARAWEITDRLIVATRDEARTLGADFLLVSISNGAQEHPKARDGWALWREWGGRPEVSLDEPERRLGALAAAESLDYLPLLGIFRAEQERTGRPLHIRWTGHWNSEGHAMAAQAIAARIVARWAASGAAGTTANR
jgi:lysophospholipase L1-like esterase